MNHAIITGPTGAIGIALVNLLFSKGIKVTVLVNPNSKRVDHLPKSDLLTIIYCDLSNLGSITGFQCDTFYHLGWKGTFGSDRNDPKMQEDNIQFSIDAVQLASRLKCKTFIFAGSQAEYGRVNKPITPETPTFPETEYGKAKLQAGKECSKWCNQFQIKYIRTRIFSVYGPFDGENTMIASTIKKLQSDIIPELTGCEQQWDYLYSKDAANAMYLLAEKGFHDATYCIGSGQVFPLRYYVEMIQNVTGSSTPLKIGAIPYAENQVMYLCADITTLTRDTGFIPQYSFQEGILEMIQTR